MKKLSLFILLLIFPVSVFASSAYGSAPSSVTKGSNVTFTVTVQGIAAWNLRLNGTGAASCSTSYADVTADGNNTTKNLTLTCRANSEGTITFTATGDITSSSGDNSNVSITKTVTVKKPREKETEARLSSLKVEDYDIDFSKNKYDYDITVEPSVKHIKIKASAISNYASIKGIGQKDIEEDEETYKVTVTAENGDKKTYKIHVYVKDENPITCKIDKKEYTVLKNDRRLETPEKFEKEEIEIDDFTIPAYKNEDLDMIVVGLEDEDKNIYYAVYKDGKYELFNETSSSNLLLYIVKGNLKNYKKTTLKIEEKEYPAYKYNKRFLIVYARDLETGKYNYYKYDKEDKTFQYFEIEKRKVNVFLITTIILSIIVILLTFLLLKKKKPKEKKKTNTKK